MVSERRTAEGGIVAVYSDITELKERETELAAKSQALEQLSNQLSKYLSPQIYQSIFTGQQTAEVAIQAQEADGLLHRHRRLHRDRRPAGIGGPDPDAQPLPDRDVVDRARPWRDDRQISSATRSMIFFGDPVSRGLKEDALACVMMAIAMQKRLESWQTSGANAGLSSRSAAGSASPPAIARSAISAARTGWTTRSSAAR